MEDRRRRELDERADVAHGAMVGSWLDSHFQDAATACRLLAKYFDELAERPMASDNVIAFPGNGVGAGRVGAGVPAPVMRDRRGNA